MYKGDVNSALEEKFKKSSSSTISTEASFDDDSNKDTLNVKKVTNNKVTNNVTNNSK